MTEQELRELLTKAYNEGWDLSAEGFNAEHDMGQAEVIEETAKGLPTSFYYTAQFFHQKNVDWVETRRKTIDSLMQEVVKREQI